MNSYKVPYSDKGAVEAMATAAEALTGPVACAVT